jgi:hypothetical protein
LLRTGSHGQQVGLFEPRAIFPRDIGKRKLQIEEGKFVLGVQYSGKGEHHSAHEELLRAVREQREIREEMREIIRRTTIIRVRVILGGMIALWFIVDYYFDCQESMPNAKDAIGISHV